jgi:hypothetical protein
MKHTVVCSALLILTALLLAACGPAATQGPMAWLDQPLDGAKLPMEPQELTAHASDDDGVTSLEFYVNGALLVRSPAAGGMLEDATVGWNPSTPGVYTIAARATDSQGNTGPDSVVIVTVGRVEGSPVPSPALVPTEEIVTVETPSPRGPTVTPIVPTWTPPPPGVTPMIPTWTPRVPTVTPPPPTRRAEIAYFQADPSTINFGWCSTLSWGVEYAAAVYLDGQGVIDHGTQQVCPATTTAYTLYATSAGGDDQETATVTVIEEPTPTPIVTAVVVDNIPPYVSDLDADPDSIMEIGWQCSGGTTTVSVLADDPSGVAGVRAYWTLESQSGQVDMTPQGGFVYKAVLGPFDISAPPANLLVSFVAWDTVGNSTPYVGPITVAVTSCIG